MPTLVELYQQKIGVERCHPLCRLKDGVATPIRGRKGWERVECGKCGTWLGDRPVPTKQPPADEVTK